MRRSPSVDARVALIQALIPLGLRAVAEALEAEVEQLAGARYGREDARPELVRWGRQRGSVYLADQKIPVLVPRVRDRQRGVEQPLTTYEQLQRPRQMDEGLFRRVLGGLACGEYAACAEAVPEAFGISRSSVSRRFVRASARRLQELQERSLVGEQWVALLIDGKSFAADELVIALGVTVKGEKRVPGLVQTATENGRVCAAVAQARERRAPSAAHQASKLA
jgi:transposase-like protein